MLAPLRDRIGPGAAARRAARIARRRAAGRQALGPQPPRDRAAEKAAAAKWRANRAKRIRQTYDDAEIAARAIRWCGLPRTVPGTRRRRRRSAATGAATAGTRRSRGGAPA